MKDIIDKANAVGPILKEYIEIHNYIFKFKWRRLLPFGRSFEAIDFRDTAIVLQTLQRELEEIRSSISTKEQEEYSIARVLIVYLDALEMTISQLYKICTRLDSKRNGLAYDWADYSRDHEEYEHMVSAYRTLGEDLNREAAKL